MGFLHFDLKKRLVKGSFGFPEREEFSTLVADQGLRSLLSFFFFLFCLHHNGSVGAGSGFFFPPFLTVQKWKTHNFHPLYLVLMAKPHPFWIMNKG